jgi:hypothetical protein
LTRRANQWHYCILTQFAKTPVALPDSGCFGAIAGQNSRQLKLHRLATANDRLRVAQPCALCDARAQGDIDVDTVTDLNKSTAMAATGQTRAAAAAQVKLSSHGYYIDHPDSELGEQLMADALGVADRNAMHGILRQLVEASMNGQKPDAVNLAFMIAMIKSIKPRDSVEAMLVAQMVSVHVMAMRCAYHLANAEDIACQDSAGRALGRLARTFPAQMEALNRYRNNGEPAITVQNVSVGDGGKAIVGNVTQHASVMVSNNSGATAVTDGRMVSMPDAGAQQHDSVDARRRAQA